MINQQDFEEIIKLAVSYCEDGMHPDDLEKDLREKFEELSLKRSDMPNA